MSLFRAVIPSPRPETVPPIMVTAGAMALYLQTGESREKIVIDPLMVPELIETLRQAAAAQRAARAPFVQGRAA